MMNCQMMQREWDEYLEGGLTSERRTLMETHLQTCEDCQALPVVGEALVTLLRQRLAPTAAPAVLRARIMESISPDGAAASPAAGFSVTTWMSNWLGSPWAPRLAMAAVLAFLLLVPLRGFLQPPVLAKEAVDRHEHHVSAAASEEFSCCKALHLQPGDILGDPSRGARVPDLSSDGLELVVATRCGYAGNDVTILAYRSAGEESFSLYITDQALDNFQEMRTKVSSDIVQARHEVRSSEVTIWERSGLIWFWVGPRSNPEYSTALADLRTL